MKRSPTSGTAPWWSTRSRRSGRKARKDEAMRTQKRQRGFTLTEVLVATAIFTIVMLAALLMYDRNNRVFKSGVQASDLQQNTRIGFDKLVSDLRIEGFDYNRNGDPSGADQATGVNYQRQPDEQIEYMGDSAIAFRSNFNYNT